jgi:hypothetical protein
MEELDKWDENGALLRQFDGSGEATNSAFDDAELGYTLQPSQFENKVVVMSPIDSQPNVPQPPSASTHDIWTSSCALTDQEVIQDALVQLRATKRPIEAEGVAQSLRATHGRVRVLMLARSRICTVYELYEEFLLHSGFSEAEHKDPTQQLRRFRDRHLSRLPVTILPIHRENLVFVTRMCHPADQRDHVHDLARHVMSIISNIVHEQSLVITQVLASCAYGLQAARVDHMTQSLLKEIVVSIHGSDFLLKQWKQRASNHDKLIALHNLAEHVSNRRANPHSDEAAIRFEQRLARAKKQEQSSLRASFLYAQEEDSLEKRMAAGDLERAKSAVARLEAKSKQYIRGVQQRLARKEVVALTRIAQQHHAGGKASARPKLMEELQHFCKLFFASGAHTKRHTSAHIFDQEVSNRSLMYAAWLYIACCHVGGKSVGLLLAADALLMCNDAAQDQAIASAFSLAAVVSVSASAIRMCNKPHNPRSIQGKKVLTGRGLQLFQTVTKGKNIGLIQHINQQLCAKNLYYCYENTERLDPELRHDTLLCSGDMGSNLRCGDFASNDKKMQKLITVTAEDLRNGKIGKPASHVKADASQHMAFAIWVVLSA